MERIRLSSNNEGRLVLALRMQFDFDKRIISAARKTEKFNTFRENDQKYHKKVTVYIE